MNLTNDLFRRAQKLEAEQRKVRAAVADAKKWIQRAFPSVSPQDATTRAMLRRAWDALRRVE